MPRPGVIIGLGGTGQWVLTWLKRDLQIWNGGQVPDNIRLLAIDTATQLEAGASRVTAAGNREEAVTVGAVKLDREEFIYLGGDSKPLAEGVLKGANPQIGKWYHAQRWLDVLGPAAFILDDGAGRIRQFGRMAIYKDALYEAQAWNALSSALNSVKTATTEQRRLEVIVVGSFAGGTGSGMFLDIALMARHLARRLGIHHVLRGYFALPSVFTNAPTQEMKARTFAAWRELNRFMVVHKDFRMPRIDYVADNPEFQITPDERIFDACYLVDGVRKGRQLPQDARYGVFPMVAEVVSAILDEEAGTAYTNWVTTNLANEYAREPNLPMYSAIGAHTVQVPAQFIQEASSVQLGQKLVLELLKPRQAPDPTTKAFAAVDAARHLALAATDANQEDKGFSGRQRSRRLLREDINYRGSVGKPTIFMGRIADVLEQSTTDDKRAALVEQLARAGGAAAGQAAAGTGWTTYFPNLGSDPEFTAVRQSVEGHMLYNVINQFGRRPGEKEDEARPRLKTIPDDVRLRFGGMTSSGVEVEDYHGQCGEALVRVADTQIVILRRLVRLRLQDLLMGRSEDAQIARTGKLGYAYDFFDGLVAEMDVFLKVMVAVKERRNVVKPEVLLEGLSAKSRNMMDAQSQRKLFWFWEHPLVRGSEQDYLRAQQRLVDVRREDILHYYVEDTARRMQTVFKEARDTLQRWIWHLSTGDAPSQIPGLWDGMREAQKGLDQAHTYDVMTPEVQRLVASVVLPLQEADLKKALTRWEWTVGYGGDPQRLELAARLAPEAAEEAALELVDPAQRTSVEDRMWAGRANQRALMQLAGRAYQGIVARTTVADEIRRQPVATFAATVANVAADPMFQASVNGAKPRKQSNMIRVMVPKNDPYFTGAQGLEGLLRGFAQKPIHVMDDSYGIQVVGSENPFKLTLVRTDDLYLYTAFAAWDDCQVAYAAHMKSAGQPLDPVLMQNFAAESSAAAYERRLSSEPYNRPYRPLHPRVVMLLENPDFLMQFVYLYILGRIAEKDRPTRWQLTWEKTYGSQTIWLTRAWTRDDEGKRPRPDLMNAMHGYVIVGQTQELDRTDVIDYGFAQRLIEREVAEHGGREWELDALKGNLTAEGLVGFLRKTAVDPDNSATILRPDLIDLADVVSFMLSEHINEIERVTATGAKPGAGAPPAGVYRPASRLPKSDAAAKGDGAAGPTPTEGD